MPTPVDKVFGQIVYEHDDLFPRTNYVLCHKCKQPVGIHDMWFDEHQPGKGKESGKYVHLKCISAKRKNEIARVYGKHDVTKTPDITAFAGLDSCTALIKITNIKWGYSNA